MEQAMTIHDGVTDVPKRLHLSEQNTSRTLCVALTGIHHAYCVTLYSDMPLSFVLRYAHELWNVRQFLSICSDKHLSLRAKDYLLKKLCKAQRMMDRALLYLLVEFLGGHELPVHQIYTLISFLAACEGKLYHIACYWNNLVADT